MRRIREAFASLWAFIVDFCVDGFGAVGFAAPVLSITFTLLKAFDVPLSGLRDLSYAWGLLPVLIWVIVAYIRRRGLNNRRRAIRQLRTFYQEADGLVWKPVASEEDLQQYVVEVQTWATSCANWIEQNLGPAARSRFLDRTNRQGVSYSGSFNEKHNVVTNTARGYRTNLMRLIETDAWDDPSH